MKRGAEQAPGEESENSQASKRARLAAAVETTGEQVVQEVDGHANGHKASCDKVEQFVLGLEHFPDDIVIEMMSKMDPRTLLSFSLTSMRFKALARRAIFKIFSYREERSGSVKLNLSQFYDFMDSVEDKSSPEFLFLLSIFEKNWPRTNLDIHRIAMDQYKQEAIVCLQDKSYKRDIVRLENYRHVPGCIEVTQLFLEHQLCVTLCVTPELVLEVDPGKLVSWLARTREYFSVDLAIADMHEIFAGGNGELLRPFLSFIRDADFRAAVNFALDTSYYLTLSLDELPNLCDKHRNLISAIFKLPFINLLEFYACPIGKFLTAHIYQLEYVTDHDAEATVALQKLIDGEVVDDLAPAVVERAFQMALAQGLPDDLILRLLSFPTFERKLNHLLCISHFKRSPALLNAIWNGIDGRARLTDAFLMSLPIDLRNMAANFAISVSPWFSSTVSCLAVTFNTRRRLLAPVMVKILKARSGVPDILDDDVSKQSAHTRMTPIQIFPGLAQVIFQFSVGLQHTCQPSGCNAHLPNRMSLILTACTMPQDRILALLALFRDCKLDEEKRTILLRALILKSANISGLIPAQWDMLSNLLNADDCTSLSQNIVHHVVAEKLIPPVDLMNMFVGEDGISKAGSFDPMIRFAVRHLKFDPTDYAFQIIHEFVHRYDDLDNKFEESFDDLLWILERLELFEQVKLYHLICAFPKELGQNDFKSLLLYILGHKAASRQAIRLHPKTDLNHFYFSLLQNVYQRNMLWVAIKNDFDNSEDDPTALNQLVLTEDFPLADFLEDFNAGRLNADFWNRVMTSPELQDFFFP